MTAASWLELCLDVHDPGKFDAMASFWSTATGLRRQPWSGSGDEPDQPDDLVGGPGCGISLCPVPEPRTVKHRVHLDVHVRAVDDLVAAGATVVQELPHWTVLTDPEGGELCAFVRAPDQDLPDYRVHEVVVDAADPERIARWWADRFGVGVLNDGEPWWWIQDVPGMAFDSLVFQPVPEPKTVKNRIHWDVHGEVDDLLAAGATRLWDQPRWTVLADPEGNEFCVFAPR